MEEELAGLGVQDNIHIEVTKLKKQVKNMPNWKSPGPDGVQGHWIKNWSNLHGNIALKLDRYLCVKELEKGNAVANLRPITCLPLLWKLLTGILAEELYEHPEQANILPYEQKGCRKGSRGTKNQLLIDKMIVKNCKKRLTLLAVAWVD